MVHLMHSFEHKGELELFDDETMIMTRLSLDELFEYIKVHGAVQNMIFPRLYIYGSGCDIDYIDGLDGRGVMGTAIYDMFSGLSRESVLNRGILYEMNMKLPVSAMYDYSAINLCCMLPDLIVYEKDNYYHVWWNNYYFVLYIPIIKAIYRYENDMDLRVAFSVTEYGKHDNLIIMREGINFYEQLKDYQSMSRGTFLRKFMYS